MKNTKLILSLIMLFVFMCTTQLYGQIREIKKKSQENKTKKETSSSNSSNTSNSDSNDSDYDTYDYYDSNDSNDSYGGSYSDGCALADGCTQLLNILENTDWKGIDPTLVSLDVRAHFDIGYHPPKIGRYTYINYLPSLRISLGFLMIDFRYNILTEYTDGFPDSFKSREFLFLLNVVHLEIVKVYLGSGIHYEEFSDTRFNEFYCGTKIGINSKNDFIDYDLRFSVDHKTGVVPFLETGLRYNKCIIEFRKVYGHITLGVIYQNYYSSHDIVSLRGGLVFNIH